MKRVSLMQWFLPDPWERGVVRVLLAVWGLACAINLVLAVLGKQDPPLSLYWGFVIGGWNGIQLWLEHYDRRVVER